MRVKAHSVKTLLSRYGCHAVAVAGVPQLLQSRLGFHPLAISQALPQASPFGVRLQKVSSQKSSVSKIRLTSLMLHARTVRASADAATGSFQPSMAILGSAVFVIVAHPVAALSTCTSYHIVHIPPVVTSTFEIVSVGSVKLSLGDPQLRYVKL